jgi:hypothetical protein
MTGALVVVAISIMVLVAFCLQQKKICHVVAISLQVSLHLIIDGDGMLLCRLYFVIKVSFFRA